MNNAELIIQWCPKVGILELEEKLKSNQDFACRFSN
jgi:hypothetical protein